MRRMSLPVFVRRIRLTTDLRAILKIVVDSTISEGFCEVPLFYGHDLGLDAAAHEFRRGDDAVRGEHSEEFF